MDIDPVRKIMPMTEPTAQQRLVQHVGARRLRSAVRERYDAVATNPEGSFNFRVGRDFALALGYPAVVLDQLPAETVKRFTGVATPVFQAAIEAGERVLDLGCGAGLDSAVAARAVGPSGSVLAIDFAGGMVRQTARMAAQLALNHVRVIQAEAEHLPLATASIDCVLVNGLFNLAPDKRAVLEEVARVVTPGGRLVAAETVLTQPLEEDEVGGLEDWFR